jgi:hypothetical protein
MARPKKYDEGEEPYGLTIRIPRDLFDELKRYAALHRQTLTEVMLDGLRMRLETPSDPRDIVSSRDDTVMLELQQLIDARIQIALAAQAFSQLASVSPTQPLPHDENTVMQERMMAHDSNTVMQPCLNARLKHPPYPATDAECPMCANNRRQREHYARRQAKAKQQAQTSA